MVNRSLLRLHREVFRNWLRFGLEQQERDLGAWLIWMGRRNEERSELLRTVEGCLIALMPQQGVPKPERLLFVDDFRVVCWLIRQSGNAAVADWQTAAERRYEPAC